EVTCIIRAVVGPACRRKLVYRGVVLQMHAASSHIGQTDRRSGYDFMLDVETPLIPRWRRRIRLKIQTSGGARWHIVGIGFQNARSRCEQRKRSRDVGHRRIGEAEYGRDKLFLKNAG